MYNRIILMGRLTKDPELKNTQSGIPMCRFSIAVDRAYSKGQEKQTDFFDITAWRQTAEFVSKYFSKGKCILIEGKLQNNNYTDQNGVKQYRNAIIADNVAFCGDKSGNRQNGQAPPAQQPYQNQYQQGYAQNQGYQQPYQQGYNQPQQYQQAPQNYQQPQQNQGYQQNYNAPAPNQPPQGYRQNNQPPQNPDVNYLGDFEEILADGEVPF